MAALQIHYGYSSGITQRSVITCLGAGLKIVWWHSPPEPITVLITQEVMSVIKMLAIWKFIVDRNTDLITKCWLSVKKTGTISAFKELIAHVTFSQETISPAGCHPSAA